MLLTARVRAQLRSLPRSLSLFFFSFSACVVSDRSHTGIIPLASELPQSVRKAYTGVLLRGIRRLITRISFVCHHNVPTRRGTSRGHRTNNSFTHALPKRPAQCLCSGDAAVRFSHWNFSAKEPRVESTRARAHAPTLSQYVCVCVRACLFLCVRAVLWETTRPPFSPVINVQSRTSRSITPLSNNTSGHWIKIM